VLDLIKLTIVIVGVEDAGKGRAEDHQRLIDQVRSWGAAIPLPFDLLLPAEAEVYNVDTTILVEWYNHIVTSLIPVRTCQPVSLPATSNEDHLILELGLPVDIHFASGNAYTFDPTIAVEGNEPGQTYIGGDADLPHLNWDFLQEDWEWDLDDADQLYPEDEMNAYSQYGWYILPDLAAHVNDGPDVAWNESLNTAYSQYASYFEKTHSEYVVLDKSPL
jgi:hypothetical protein